MANSSGGVGILGQGGAGVPGLEVLSTVAGFSQRRDKAAMARSSATSGLSEQALCGPATGPGASFLGGEDDNFDSLGGDGVDTFGGLSGGEGIYAEGGGTGLAGEFGGNVTVHGNVSKAGGSFRIDHPLDPANQYLSHSFVESQPDMKNIYDGNESPTDPAVPPSRCPPGLRR